MGVFDELKGGQYALCDVIYQKPQKGTDWHDYITFVYKDIKNDSKKLISLCDPEYDIYEVKQEYRTFKKTRHYLPKEQCIKHTIKYKDRYKEIAKIAGEESPEMDFYKNNLRNRTSLDQLYKYPYVLGADISIETYYRVIWDKDVGNAPYVPTCIYLDIEVDQKGYEGKGISRHGECPINAICITDDITNTVYQFLLYRTCYTQIDDFINDQESYQKELHEAFDESYGNGSQLTFNIYMIDDEKELLERAWQLIHSLKRDFMLIWNAPFDMPYMEDRYRVLGGNPETLMCHSDFPSTMLYFKLDDNIFDQALKRDHYEISCYTRVINQLSLYPSLRRSKGAIRRLNLGAVAWNEMKDTKLDYTDVGNFIQFPYNDYRRFSMYNIKDTLLQMGLNRKCRDMTSYYNSCYGSYCGYKDGLKQTVSLRSLFYHELLEDGFIIGNNANFDNFDPNEKKNKKKKGFAGAIIGESMLNDYEGLEIFAKKSMFYFGCCIDFDFSSMYPNLMLVFNLFAVCMIGKIFIENDERFRRYDKDGGKEFIDDYIARNWTFFGNKWLNLPSFSTIYTTVGSRLKR